MTLRTRRLLLLSLFLLYAALTGALGLEYWVVSAMVIIGGFK